MNTTAHRRLRAGATRAVPGTLAGLAALAALTTLAACSSDDSSSSAPASAREQVAAADDAGGSTADRMLADEMAVADQDTGSVAAPVAELETEDASIISTGWVDLEADDVDAARFDIRKIVDAHQGTITEQETSTGDDGDVATSRMVIRIPSARFADAFADLEEAATLTDSSSADQDVSTDVVDVDARVRAQRKSVARIEALLARAETIDQVVSIESQLASRQAELDALLSRQQWLADQTALSTITVYVQQPDDDSDDPAGDERDGFLGGLQDGWDSFLDAMSVTGAVLGFVVPWAAIIALLGLPLWLARRRRTA